MTLLFDLYQLLSLSLDHLPFSHSGLTHEIHARDVEQVYLRCSQGTLEWLYPTGAIVVNLRPNTDSPDPRRRLSVCIKPSRDSRGTNIYLDRAGELRLLLREEEQSLGRVQCFGIQEGALFIEAIQHRDISRRITAFQYELVSERQDLDSRSGKMAAKHPTFSDSYHPAPCQPCNDQEVLLALCTSDFAARGSILRMEKEEEKASITVMLSRLYRQKSQVFLLGGRRMRGWTGCMWMPPRCEMSPGEGEYLFTGTVRFGEAWLGCASRYEDFLRLYRKAVEQGTNPCHIDMS
ncbi:meteorin-like protein-like [Scleropages formosus]|uniref:Meteorin-like protein n=1 Tax=Scleropages formosus TaxID=113540 RepID=A0A0P7TVD5_SCLFO|nr:meteorin-like protein-like [Scleropages formosus]